MEGSNIIIHHDIVNEINNINLCFEKFMTLRDIE
jgi:hypothetical protein